MRYAENYSKCAVLKYRFKTGVCTFRIFGRSLLAVSTERVQPVVKVAHRLEAILISLHCQR